MSKRKRFMLPETEIPTQWYNITAEMKNKPLPMINPQTKEELKAEDLFPLFAEELSRQEVNQTDTWIDIPDEVRDKYKIYRPTPLVRATELEKALDTPAHIYFKNESVSPVGSHKLNSALPQAYYNKVDGTTNITTETGAGQWGTALAFAAKAFGLELAVYMVKISYEQKPYRRSLMQTWGAQVAEAYQSMQINYIAKEISKRFNDGVKVVFISGPSSSGKTTFRKRLEVQLMVNLLKPVGISLDDYFVNRDNTPLDENGEKDYESLYALDLELFEDHMLKLMSGETVELPTYNFVTGKREYRGNFLKMDNNSILIIEGIHGLNPKLTEHIPEDMKFKIYVSALTTISLDDHNWIPASDNRLIRRIVRDYRYRGYSAQTTISRWDSVRHGEDKWIFPFQENADVMFNSAMIYELAAIRRHAEPILMQVPRTVPEYSEAYRLLKFLGYFNYITDRELPPTSLLREFLGGSSFRY
jgi:uridine kinase